MINIEECWHRANRQKSLNDQTVRCPDCLEEFKTLEDLDWHQETINNKKTTHNTDSRVPQIVAYYCCPKCDRTYTSKGWVKRHLRTYHNFVDES